MSRVSDMIAGRSSFSVGGYEGAARTSIANGWDTDYKDPNWVFGSEGVTLGARSEELLRNNPVAAAAIGAMVDGTLGEEGLRWRSLFSRDLEKDTDDREDKARRRLTWNIQRATMGTRFDARGQSTWRQLLEQTLVTTLATGNAFSVRLWRPERQGRQYQASCVRLLHPSRVSNPDHQPDGKGWFRGLKLDGDGNPTHIAVRQYALVQDGMPNKWAQIPIFDANGTRQVTHLRRAWHPEQYHGDGWLAPILPLLKQFGGTTDAYVVAKRIQACFPVIVETDDPTALAAAQRNGSLLAQGTKLTPGKVYVVKTGTMYKFENLQFNGADHQAFAESLLQLASAALGLPYEIIINRLGKSNLASARAALLAAFRTFRIQQHNLITQVLDTWVEWIVQEDLMRQRMTFADLGTSDLDLVLRGKWLRPPVPTPNPKQDLDAARTAIDLGTAPTDAFAMFGLPDHDPTVHQAAQDQRLRQAQGVVYNATGGMGGAQPGQDGDPADPEDDPNDPADPADPSADPAADPATEPSTPADPGIT